MNPTFDQMHRRLGRNVIRLGALVLLAVAGLTIVGSAPASAYAPRIHKPGAPTAVTAIPLSGGAAVSWTAPASDGGSPITGYTVIASHDGQTCTTTGATTCTVTGLTNGHLYRVHVRASNAKGEGPASARVPVTPLPTVSFVNVFPYTGGPVSVTLSQPTRGTVHVDFTTSNGPDWALYWAQWIGDAAAFSPNSGTVTFVPGQTTATISFTVNPSNVTGCSPFFPPIACFPSLTVTLVNPTNAVLDPTPFTTLSFT
jgi:Fibronectin type III domain